MGAAAGGVVRLVPEACADVTETSKAAVAVVCGRVVRAKGPPA